MRAYFAKKPVGFWNTYHKSSQIFDNYWQAYNRSTRYVSAQYLRHSHQGLPQLACVDEFLL